VDKGGRVLVKPDMSLPGHPDIFVIGDLAHYAHQTGKPLPGLAHVAMQQGSYVGRLITNRLLGRALPLFHYQERGNLATIGRGAAVAEIGRLRLSGWLAWHLWLYIHLTYLVDAENRVLVLVQWLWNFVTRNRSAMLIVDSKPVIREPRSRNSIIFKTDTGSWPVVR
jgi:NADH dehydrogenase